MLELDDVSGAYGSVKALNHLSLRVDPGQVLVVVGRNGAGKSTTLRLIAGSIQPAGGTITWQGDPLNGLPPQKRVELGIVLVPEGRGIFPSMTVEENLRMGGFSMRRLGRSDTRRQLDWVCEVVPIIGNRRRQMAGSLSGGEQQLLAVGRGLMARPRLLMLDEPSLGLSPLMVKTLYGLLDILKEEKMGMIVVEQYVEMALRLGDEVLALSNGAKSFHGPPRELANSAALAALYMGEVVVDEHIEGELTETLSH